MLNFLRSMILRRTVFGRLVKPRGAGWRSEAPGARRRPAFDFLEDRTVPAAITTATRKLYHKSPAVTDFAEFPDRGHSLIIDHNWREVAQRALDWLNQRSF